MPGHRVQLNDRAQHGMRLIHIDCGATDGQLAVLGLEVIAPQQGRLDLTHRHRRGQPPDRRAVLNQLLVVQITDPEELPPPGTSLAPVPADQPGQRGYAGAGA